MKKGAVSKGGGTSSYHPRLMLKVLIYGYLTNLYSSRKIEQALHQNIHFMWLRGMSYPAIPLTALGVSV